MAVEPPPTPPVPSEPSSPSRFVNTLLYSPVVTVLVVTALVVLIGIVPVRYLAGLASQGAVEEAPPAPKSEPVVAPEERTPAPPPVPEPARDLAREAALKARDNAQEAATKAKDRYRDEAGVPLEQIESFSSGQRWLGNAEKLLDSDPVEARRVFDAATTAFDQVGAPPQEIGLGQARADFALAVRSAQERFVLAGDLFDKCMETVDLKGLEAQAQALERKQDWNGARAIYAGAILKLNACQPSEPESLQKALRDTESALNACIRRFKLADQEPGTSSSFREVRELYKTGEDAREAGRYVEATATFNDVSEMLRRINPVKAPAPSATKAKAAEPAPDPEPEPKAEPQRKPEQETYTSKSPEEPDGMAAEAKAAINRAEVAASSARERFARAERLAERNPGYSHAKGVLESARESMAGGYYKNAIALAIQATKLFEASAPEAWKNVEVNQFTPPVTLP